MQSWILETSISVLFSPSSLGTLSRISFIGLINEIEKHIFTGVILCVCVWERERDLQTRANIFSSFGYKQLQVSSPRCRAGSAELTELRWVSSRVPNYSTDCILLLLVWWKSRGSTAALPWTGLNEHSSRNSRNNQYLQTHRERTLRKRIFPSPPKFLKH